MEFKNNTFKIVQFTDTHFGNLPHHEDDIRTFNLIDNILTKEKPDLIVHTGDIMWSDGVKNSDKVFQIVMEYFNKYDIPLAITFGNHDSEEGITRSELREIYDKIITNKPEKIDSFIIDDKENYLIPLSENGDDLLYLYFIDSGADDRLGFGTYEWVLPEQVEWFRKTSAKYKKNDGIKRNIIFQHIPVPEYWQSKENILSGVQEETNEEISAPKINTGLFANMLLNGETWGMIVGHDHENNFDSTLHGIHLAYANSSGYQAYGDLPKGATVIEITKDPFEIKIRNIKIDADK
ncbi:metallophosphoesterase family protein [Anaerococcus sp. ENR1011]|uniref:Metallophosphoesterase family protein n=1 Tax=Anaerococcus groningensis TaxID=3115616 RepID=A0ABW9N033_9FIRM